MVQTVDVRVSQVDLKHALVMEDSSFVNVTCPGEGRGFTRIS